AGDRGTLLPRDVEVIAVEFELFQFAFQFARVHAEVEQRGDEHVAGNAADEVEVERLHAKVISATDEHRLTQIKKPAEGADFRRRIPANKSAFIGVICGRLNLCFICVNLWPKN